MLHRLMEYRTASNAATAAAPGKVCLTTCDPFFDLKYSTLRMLNNKQLTQREVNVLARLVEVLKLPKPDCRIGTLANEHDVLNHACLYMNLLTAPLTVADVIAVNAGTEAYCDHVIHMHASYQYNVPLWTELKIQFKELLALISNGKITCRSYKNALRLNVLNLNNQ